MADLSPAELAELSKRLQLLIDQARTLQQEIAQRSEQHHRANRPDHTGEPPLPPDERPAAKRKRPPKRRR